MDKVKVVDYIATHIQQERLFHIENVAKSAVYVAHTIC